MSADRPSFVVGERFALGDRWITPGINEIDGVRVDPKAMDVLVALVEAAPLVLSGNELLERVWPDVVVVHNVVYQAIAQLRKALGDEAHAPQYIETIPRRGYRVVAEIKYEEPTRIGRVGSFEQQLDNLPNPLTSFIGRQHELTESRNLLSSNRLLTLTGVGGCGKTRLAVALGKACQADFADGVWLVELASITGETRVGAHVARALGVSEGGAASARERLVEVLANRRLLLIMDNCEHLIDACAHLVEALLTRAPGVRIVATSREALGIGGERALQVHPLTTPDLTQHVSLLELARVESVQLFTERAVSIQQTFALTPENSAAVASICRRLDGIPLAIELAAAQVRCLSVDQISARLSDRFRLLTGGSRTALPRQRTLAATMDWSYELLPVPQRILLRRLSVFAGGFTLEAAENVGALDPLKPSEIFDLLMRLVDQSMVQVSRSNETPRYRLLETVRQYGHDRLLESTEGDLIRVRHCDYFRALSCELRRELFAECGVDVFPRFLSEQDNLELALGWCLEADPEIGLSLANSLGPLWSSLGLIGRMHWFEDFLSVSSEPTDARVEALRQGPSAMQQLKQPFREDASAGGGLHRVAQRHLLERKDHAVPGALFDAHRARRNLREAPIPQQLLELAASEHFVPTLMCLDLVAALEVEIVAVAEPVRKIFEELPPTSLHEGRVGWLVHGQSAYVSSLSNWMKQKPWPNRSLKLTQREPRQSTWPVSCFAPAASARWAATSTSGTTRSKWTGVQCREYSRSIGGVLTAGVPPGFCNR